MKSFIKSHRRSQSSDGVDLYFESHSTLKKLNPLTYIRRASGSHVDLRWPVDSDIDGEAYKNAGIIFGTRRPEWDSSGQSIPVHPRVVSAPARRPSEVACESQSSEEKDDPVKIKEVEEDANEIEKVVVMDSKGTQVLESISEQNGTVLETETEDTDKRSVFSFEEDQSIGRNLSVKYHKTTVVEPDEYGDEDTIGDGSVDVDIDFDALALEDFDDIEESGHLFRSYEDNFMPISKFDSDNSADDSGRPTDTPPLTAPAFKRKVLPLQINRMSMPPGNLSDEFEDLDYYDGLLDEANAIPDEDELEWFAGNATSLRRAKTSPAACFSRMGSTLSRRQTSVLRMVDNTITFYHSSGSGSSSRSSATSDLWPINERNCDVDELQY
uniref:ARAD1D44770p n=1 Tax=Blastobotrys adeninivorans TaxID=409370 RepID=A0A060TJ72_BLAAD